MSSASRGLAPREGLECLVDEDGTYEPASPATPWAAGRQVWGPPPWPLAAAAAPLRAVGAAQVVAAPSMKGVPRLACLRPTA